MAETEAYWVRVARAPGLPLSTRFVGPAFAAALPIHVIVVRGESARLTA